MNSNTRITVDQVCAFAAKSYTNVEPFYTFGRHRPFRVKRSRTGITIYPQSTRGSYCPINREKIAEYLEHYYKAPVTERRRPSALPDKFFERSYMAVILSSINAVDEYDSQDTAKNPRITNTEKAITQLARIGQGVFRDALLDSQECCYVTGIRDPQLLRASHIKSWKDSDHGERLDPNNGLLLTPLYDHLFDNHLISFTDDGCMPISKLLSEDVIKRLGIKVSFQGRPFRKKAATYLKEHRAIFCSSGDQVPE